MLLLVLMFFSEASHAAAANVCAPLGELHETVNFCEDNVGYLPPSSACVENYRALVKSKNAEIQKILAGNMAGRTGAQHVQFETTEAAYSYTEALLTSLLQQGKKTHAELEAYADDFVPPIPSDAAGHWKPSRKDPHDPARDPEFYCWNVPMKEMDALIEEVESMMSQLEATRAKTAGLRLSTSVRDNALNVLNAKAGKGAANISGESPRDHSTITGKIGNKDLENPLATAKVVKLNLPKAELKGKENKNSPKNRISAITGETLFSHSLEDASSKSNGPGGSAGERSGSSLGSLIWSEPKESDKIDMELSIAPAQNANGKALPAPSGSGNSASGLDSSSSDEGVNAIAAANGIRVPASADTGNSSEFAQEKERSPASSRINPSLAVASAETNLFALVSGRYRATELFRRAQVSTVPLNGFAPSLKR